MVSIGPVPKNNHHIRKKKTVLAVCCTLVERKKKQVCNAKTRESFLSNWIFSSVLPQREQIDHGDFSHRQIIYSRNNGIFSHIESSERAVLGFCLRVSACDARTKPPRTLYVYKSRLGLHEDPLCIFLAYAPQLRVYFDRNSVNKLKEFNEETQNNLGGFCLGINFPIRKQKRG